MLFSLKRRLIIWAYFAATGPGLHPVIESNIESFEYSRVKCEPICLSHQEDNDLKQNLSSKAKWLNIYTWRYPLVQSLSCVLCIEVKLKEYQNLVKTSYCYCALITKPST
ncbi:hypothetical protein ATANTOWER_016218 [Ataeniobius toweri]|uniref:Uncharacterized protein n=1 Tax=Ataeniobius toweri TaxID=208326 RepID=A0ABU7B001_9TELE|nr:hypothetical protein [Ataeniobius toweri]